MKDEVKFLFKVTITDINSVYSYYVIACHKQGAISDTLSDIGLEMSQYISDIKVEELCMKVDILNS